MVLYFTWKESVLFTVKMAKFREKDLVTLILYSKPVSLGFQEWRGSISQ